MTRTQLTWWIFFWLSVLLSRMYVRETLTFYVLPWFTHMVLVASIILGLLGIYLITSKADFHQIRYHTRTIQMIALVFVVVFGFLLPAQPLSNLTIHNRWVQTNIDQLRISDYQGDNNTSKHWLTFPDVILMMQKESFDLIDTWEKTVHVKGYIHPSSSDINDEFDLVQFQMACCIADARPVGIRVKQVWDHQYKEGDWVEVFWRLMYEDNETDDLSGFFVVPDQIQKTELLWPPFFY